MAAWAELRKLPALEASTTAPLVRPAERFNQHSVRKYPVLDSGRHGFHRRRGCRNRTGEYQDVDRVLHGLSQDNIGDVLCRLPVVRID